jgi:hypothetical protein
MAEQKHTRQAGDVRTVLGVTLQQNNTAGTATAVDLNGLTVQFRMVDTNGVDVVEQTATGVTVTNATSGEVEYDFSTAGVASSGQFYAYFIVIDGVETDHFPVEPRELIICIGDVA